MGKIVTGDMNSTVCPSGESILDDAFHSLRSHRTDNYLAAQFFSHAQRLFEGVAVRLADLEGKIAFFNPGFIFTYAQNRVFIRDLLHHYYDLHKWSVVRCQWSVVSGPLSVVRCQWSVVDLRYLQL